jgi:ribosomal protein S27E
MKAGSAVYCPTCHNRQTVGTPGEKLEFPVKVPCQSCGAVLVLEKSRSGGIHVTAEGAVAR